MQNCVEIYITDKSGNKYWKTLCSADYVEPERRNLQRHLDLAVINPQMYHFLDLKTAKIEQTAKTVGEQCQHKFYYFGDQQKKRRCVNCDQIESTK